MRAILGVFIMATGLLGALMGGSSGAETGKNGAPMSNAMQTQAPDLDKDAEERVNQLTSMVDDLRRGRIKQEEFNRLSDQWHKRWYPNLEGAK